MIRTPSFQPEMTSTRLKSEEIYRERIASDSLFAARTRNPSRANVSNATNDPSPDEQQVEESSTRQDDVFENEDLFGPPPLPKAGTKSAKSKVTSLFDDSDSGDELFSTTSSGSRSQKSTDFLVTTPQNPDKSKSTVQRKGIFDEDIDIFGTKDAPDVDLFAIASKATTSKEDVDSAAQNFSSVPPLVQDKSSMPVFPKDTSEKDQASKRARKKTSLFDDDDDDDANLFNVSSVKSEDRIFQADEEDDLFSSAKVISKEPIPPRISIDKAPYVKAKPDTVKSSSSLNEQKKTTNLSGEDLFSKVSSTHESLFDDEDFDDLFGKKEDSCKIEETTRDSEIVKESKIESVEEGKIENVEKMSSNINESKEKIVKKSQDLMNTSDTPAVNIKPTVPAKPTIKDIEETTRENVDGEIKKYPPKTLNIKANIPSSIDENSQVPKRAVSGKIKDLMGKMGDFKVLSPTDKPPLWKKSEEKIDEDEDAADRDSDDGGCISTQSRASPPTISEDAIRRQSPPSGDSSSNAEGAVSFDDPVQVETLTTASKSRVRIQAKRRPQSRHARKSALRNSGIDFDTVDTVDAQQETGQDQTQGLDSDNFSKELSEATIANRSNNDRLSGLFVDNPHRNIDTLTSSTADDRSELGSLSKESTMSANKNTLLSPSTDEEDLFDVPPDLPEDSQNEDSLFGRAPILSPIENVLREKSSDFRRSFKDSNIIDRTIEGASSDNETASKFDAIKSEASESQATKADESKEIDNKNSSRSTERSSSNFQKDQEEMKEEEKLSTKTDSEENVFDILSEKEKQISKTRKEEKDGFDRKSIDEPTDPLRDSSHDPLKDPSQLFAFVTKTSSPEKGKNLLFAEDDSLFSSSMKRNEGHKGERKQVLDLFADDTGGDLFSAPLTKSVMKPLKDTKITLFDDDVQNDEDDSLFGSIAKKLPDKSEGQRPKTNESAQKKINIFDDDDDDGNLFVERTKSHKIGSSEISQQDTSKSSEVEKSSKLKYIFDDQSSGEDDIFAGKKIVPKKNVSNVLFASDDEDDGGQIFGKPSSSIKSKVNASESKPTVKKAVTRDLKKTAEKIVEDPLSLLQDD